MTVSEPKREENYRPDPNLSEAQRLIVIETLLVSTLAALERSQGQARTLLLIIALLAATAFIIAGVAWVTITGTR